MTSTRETQPPPKTPFTILTGWLGAGKTTVLNRVLALGSRRVAVLVNDLGRVNIDRRLLASQDGDFLELSNGCVCCAIDVQRDLWTGIIDVVERSRPQHVVLETTGIAEPQVILDGLEAREVNKEHVFAAGVIAVVDAEAGRAQIERRHEVRAQIECADRLLISKLDVAGADEVAALHARLAELNPVAERAAFPATQAGDVALGAWLLEARPESVASKLRTPGLGKPHRHGQLSVATFVDEHPLVAAPLVALVEGLGDALMRAKGFVNLAGESRRGFVERAGTRTQLVLGEPWADGEPRRSELVLIGDGLDEASLRRALWACRAG
jgi:G3E family GTPase